MDNIQNIFAELENQNYHLYLDKGQVRYKCLSLIEPPKDKVIALLDTLKRNREAVIGYLKPKQDPIPFDTLKTLYMDAFNRTGWQYGLMARPEVIQIEDKLNQSWIAAMEGQAGLDDFKTTLAGWEAIISNAMTQKEAFNE